MLRHDIFQFTTLVLISIILAKNVCALEDGGNGSASNVPMAQSMRASSIEASSTFRSSAIASRSASTPSDFTPSSNTFITSISTRTLFSVSFTPAPNARGIANAESCWNGIMTWANQSAEWYNAHVVGRTWDYGPTTSSTTSAWSSSTTIYPSDVSIYTLCDGTPRANVRPITKHFSGNYTTTWTDKAPMTPEFRSQPCTPDPEMCRMWYYDSNIQQHGDDELVRQCGLPAHQEAPCLIGGGPVQIVYFPVTTEGGNLCGHNGSTVPATVGPNGPATVTTLGHTFTSGSVYLSFKSLYASYDGFWDRIGPTFSDFILPLPSSAISTQCGGWGNAHGPGTQINYADLNWPVPASAYSCQDRCSRSWTSDCPTCSASRAMRMPECNTIWSDVDPVLAVPTQARDLVPEWSTCSFWDLVIPNFWFDPPIALDQQGAEVTATMPSTPITSSAAPQSIPQDPQPKNTATAQSPHPVHTSNAGAPDPNSAPAAKTTANGVPFNPSPEHTHSPQQTQDPKGPAPQPDPVRLPALSILEEALSSMVPETDPALKSMISVAHSIGNSFLNHNPAQQTAESSHLTGAIVTVSGTAVTAVQSSGRLVLGSHTLKVGQAATISGVVVSAGSTGLVVGSRTAAITALPGGPEYSTIPFALVASTAGQRSSDGIEVVTAGSLTMTMSTVDSSAVVVDGTTLSAGGPEATIDGHIISDSPSGLVWMSPVVSHSTEPSLPAVVTGTSYGTTAVNGQPGPESSTAGAEASSTSTSGAMSRRVAWHAPTFEVAAVLMLVSVLVLL